MKKSWISEHPRIVIGLVLAVCLGPFINKAIHVDDPLFIWAGEWIQKHPADFFGSEVNWYGHVTPMWLVNCNPPLMSYFLAAVASVFGWNEIVLHLAGLAVAFMAAAGVYALAKMWCGRPLLATVAAIFTPVFLVSSSTLMCDVLMLTFWIWALVLWERALAGGQSRWRFMGAGVLAGLAVLTKYSAVTLLPLLPILGVLRTRKLGWWLVGTAVPLFMVAAYEWITAGMYGNGLLSAAAGYAQTHRFSDLLSDWKARGIISLAFAGGSLLPLLFFAPFLWRRQTLLAGGVVVFGLLLGTFCLSNNLWLVRSWDDPALMNHRDFMLQLTLLTAAGLHLLLLVAADVGQRRDAISTTLGVWIMSGFLFASVLNWTVNARSFLPLAPAVAILLVRRLDATRANFMAGSGVVWPLVPSAIVALGLVMADCRVADSARTAAMQIAACTPPNHQLWFEGHWGFQYYLEKLGGQPMDVERSLLQPGDLVVVPFDNSNFMPLPAGSVGWVNDLQYSPDSWINLSAGSASESGGFYSSVLAPVPFAVGKVNPHVYCLVKVLSRVQFNTQFAKPRETPKGVLPPVFSISFAVEPESVCPVKPEVAGEMQLADRSQRDGNIQEAIQHYRNALAMDSNDPLVLNNLAWILTTAGKPELRNGQEAVRLATRAVELTGRRQPIFIGTLAAACAQAGQFPEAVILAGAACNLARVTGQTEVAVKNARLRRLYAAGKTVDASGDP